MRAIDEIEDHPGMRSDLKQELLAEVARALSAKNPKDQKLQALLDQHKVELDAVSYELPSIAAAVPSQVQDSVYDATAAMAEEMADWVRRDWKIESQQDLDDYTFTVAGRVGLMLSELWTWFDGTQCDRDESIGFGRALQTVNIIRNRKEDGERGVSFYPPDWCEEQMFAYARHQISLADSYMGKLDRGAVYNFCIIPLTLAKATLHEIEQGNEKLSRQQVEEIMQNLDAGQ